MKKFLTLLHGDFKNISRDPLLLFAMILPLLVTMVLRYAFPVGAEIIQRNFGFDLREHYTFAVSMLILFTPMMLGVLTGFIILDDRDENILIYFSVTPLGKTGYLLYRLMNPVLLSILFSLLVLILSGVKSGNFAGLLPVVFMAAMEAPIMALLLSTFSANKVEGLAVSKGLGILFVAPLAGYLVKSGWQYILGIFPPFWVCKTFISSKSIDCDYFIFLTIGFISHMVIMFILFWRYKRKAM